MNLGSNNHAGVRLMEFIERIERVRADKKQLQLDEAAIFAEAKADGYDPKPMRKVIVARSQKPQEREEADNILDTYMHAAGLATEPPLHRQIARIGADIISRDSVVEAMKQLVPANGSITVETKDGKPVKLTRDKDGNVSVTEIEERPIEAVGKPAGAKAKGRAAKPEPPDVDGDGAETLGQLAFQANQPIISNPFPYGDARRGRWDAGWRKASGGDGMGPDRGE